MMAHVSALAGPALTDDGMEQGFHTQIFLTLHDKFFKWKFQFNTFEPENHFLIQNLRIPKTSAREAWILGSAAG